MERFLTDLWQELNAQWAGVRRVVAVWAPTAPVPPWVAPVVALAGLLSLVAMTGLALASFGMLLVALLVAYLILEQVFGVTIRLA